MALSLLQLGETNINYLELCLKVIEQVLKIDAQNMKALTRKCMVLIDLERQTELQEVLAELHIISQQKNKPMTIEKEIERIKKFIQDYQNQKRHSKDGPKLIEKEKDWYYNYKKKKQQDKELEEQFL